MGWVLGTELSVPGGLYTKETTDKALRNHGTGHSGVTIH